MYAPFKTAKAAVVLSAVLAMGCGEDGDDPVSIVVAEITRSAEDNLPVGVPPIALQQPPTRTTVPVNIWPFEEGTPRTHGTGRYFGGAFYWTDFVYDANGAQGAEPSPGNTGTPSGGSLRYPGSNPTANGYDMAADRYEGNGADIFSIGIGADETLTYWRVDWQTLKFADAPIIAFGLDTDNNFETGTDATTEWPGVPRIRTAGVDKVLLISSAGAFVADATGVRSIGSTFTSADRGAQQTAQYFIAHIPRDELDPQPGSRWVVRAVSGLNDGNGAFLDEMTSFQGGASQPPVFNAAFRDYVDEPALTNSWFNSTQAQALNTGSVEQFSILLEWDRLGEDEGEPIVNGYSNRWYYSSLGPQFFGRGGKYTGADASQVEGGEHFDRIQPYGVRIPSSYDFSNPQPARLTLLLHSFTQNHNQYAGTVPNYLFDTCERLVQSICITTLGRGQSGGYENEAEVDLWEVLRDLATYFSLDPDRVFTSGYSMGANGTIRLLIKYPDIFAAGAVLAGAQSGDSPPACLGEQQLENFKWNPYYHAHGNADQLIPISRALDTIDAIRQLGYRYVFDQYNTKDHVAWTLEDVNAPAFLHASEWFRDTAPATRKLNPGEIIYRWTPADVTQSLGIGPSGPWWVGDLAVADENYLAPDCAILQARVHAISAGIPERPYIANDAAAEPRFDATGQHTHYEQTWELDEAPSIGGLLTLDLINMGRLSIDMDQAGIANRTDKRVEVSSDSALNLILRNLPADTTATLSGNDFDSTGGDVTIPVPAGDSVITFN